MQLTTTQLQTLKAAIAAETDPAFIALRTSGQTGAMADYYNTASSPAVKAWNKSQEAGATDEACDWTVFDAIVAGKRDSWGFFLQRTRDFSRAKIRKWVTDVWGNATAGSAAEAILQAATRTATKGEAVFGGTDRTTGTVTAKDLTIDGAITNQNIVDALAS